MPQPFVSSSKDSCRIRSPAGGSEGATVARGSGPDDADSPQPASPPTSPAMPTVAARLVTRMFMVVPSDVVVALSSFSFDALDAQVIGDSTMSARGPTL